MYIYYHIMKIISMVLGKIFKKFLNYENYFRFFFLKIFFIYGKIEKNIKKDMAYEQHDTSNKAEI